MLCRHNLRFCPLFFVFLGLLPMGSGEVNQIDRITEFYPLNMSSLNVWETRVVNPKSMEFYKHYLTSPWSRSKTTQNRQNAMISPRSILVIRTGFIRARLNFGLWQLKIPIAISGPTFDLVQAQNWTFHLVCNKISLIQSEWKVSLI